MEEFKVFWSHNNESGMEISYTNCLESSGSCDNFTNVSDTYSSSHYEVKHSTSVIVVYTLAYVLVFLFAFLGNLIVIAVVCRNKWMHNVTNFFIVNLAIADVLVACFCLPITLLTNIFTEWRYGAIMCKGTPFLQGLSVCASVNTLAAIAIDRYLAICYTLNYKMTWKTSKLIMCFIWIFSLIDMTPNLIFYKLGTMEVTQTQNVTVCYPDWPSPLSWKLYLIVGNVLFCYTVPLMLIVTCYAMIGYRVWNRDAPGVFRSNGVVKKSKVRVCKMLGLVVLVFALSWLPLWVTNIRLTFFETDDTTKDLMFRYIIPISQWLGLSNSGINPIIYCLFSKRIRLRIKAMLQCQTRRHEINRHHSRFSSTRYVSVDYTNGLITLRTCALDNKRIDTNVKRTSGNMYD